MSDLLSRAKIKVGLLRMGEPVAFGSDAAMIEELCAELEQVKRENEQLRAELSMWQEVKHSSHWKERALAAEATVKHSLPVATWRDIPCADLDWIGLNDHSYRAARAVDRLCRTEWDPWGSLSLGELADMGERRWRHHPGIGDKAVLVIKRTIDLAAEGEMVTAKAAAADAYIPTCERDKENNQ